MSKERPKRNIIQKKYVSTASASSSSLLFFFLAFSRLRTRLLRFKLCARFGRNA
ncbi:unnamed protein product [Tetraodon nigroviridis]|uniref:(spotted green pufferfish) hypothetical protein n=1 Tax=Tetraodon nigroviridis TaxID=99883 RepID=Q4SZ33_TETNG|nr:unnamed protein product [Tetraodon nigroviridis]